MPPLSVAPQNRIAILIGVIVIYLAAAIGSALTQRPWCDEAWNSSPALTLMTRGHMGTPVLDPSGIFFPLTGIDQYTYWIMPLHPFSQIFWYRVFGFGVFQLRAYSMMWGLVALASWFAIMKILSRGETNLALLTITLIAMDFIFIQRSSEGRMDIMSAALGFASFAVYLAVRDTKISLAIFLSHSLMAANALTHPNAIMHFAGLLFLTLYFDRRRIRWWHLLVAVTPYLIGAICWGFYILKAPDWFRVQLSGNSTNRFEGLRHPLSYLKLEITERYLPYLAGISPTLSRAHQLKIFVLLGYFTGLVGSIIIRAIRQHSGYRVLLVLTAINFVNLTFLDGVKNPLYLIHIVPLFLALLAVFIFHAWRRFIFPRWSIACLVILFLAVELGGVLYVIRRDNYGRTYRPALAFLKQNMTVNTSIIGGSELGFEIGFFGNLTDDLRLGYYSGKTPDFIVVDERYLDWFGAYKLSEPQVYRYIINRLDNEYKPVYMNPGYTIYSKIPQNH